MSTLKEWWDSLGTIERGDPASVRWSVKLGGYRALLEDRPEEIPYLTNEAQGAGDRTDFEIIQEMFKVAPALDWANWNQLDRVAYGEADYWSAHLEEFQAGTWWAGDCDDYALTSAEYFADYGVPDEDNYLLITYWEVPGVLGVRKVWHMVNGIEIDGRMMIMDINYDTPMALDDTDQEVFMMHSYADQPDEWYYI